MKCEVKLEEQNKMQFKKMLSILRLVKLSVKSFLIKGRVVEHEIKLLI